MEEELKKDTRICGHFAEEPPGRLSVHMWDINQRQELCGVLGNLLLHYILLPRHSEAIRSETEAMGRLDKVT